MHFHIILTEKCNSRCRYCYDKSSKEFGNKLNEKFEFDYSAPADSNVKVGDLKKFIEKDSDPTIIFYGGEPLVNLEKLKEIMDNVDAKFCMQTNGKLLHQIPKEYLNRMSRILVSIDGGKEITDFNRGEGTYDLILKNIKLIRENGFVGEIVARMTVPQENPKIFENVKHLLDLKIFNSVHWQLDVGFYEFDFEKEKIEKFVEEYNQSISKLIEFWIEEMQKGTPKGVPRGVLDKTPTRGNVLKLYPFLGIMQDILNETKTKLRCGSGYANYTITTEGTLTCCPIMNSIKNFYVGDIKESDPDKLKEISVGNPCTECDYLDLCGGRCLYANRAKLWPPEGEELVCKTIKHLIDSLKSRKREIEELIEEGKINLEDFEYEKYFGPEIIP